MSMSVQNLASSPNEEAVRLTVAGPGTGSIPPRARFVSGLAERSLNGEWQFLLSPSLAEAPEGVEAEDADTSAWGTIPVPSSWPMLGHGKPAYTNVKFPFPVDPPHVPDANPVGDHRLVFDASEEFLDGALLRFDGIDSAGTIWLNGTLLGTTRGSRLPSEFAVGDILRARDNVLVVRVVQFSAASYLEDQDMWWLPGIFRDVTLVQHPADALVDLFAHADYAGGHGTLRIELTGTLADEAVISVPELGLSGAAGETLEAAVEPWSAEVPRLYDVEVATSRQVVRLRIGFRTVRVENGLFTVNGKAILFRGVNRHEIDPDGGRVVPLDRVRAELVLMKQHNVNAVRTSHYPPHPLVLDLFDELGFYVIDECDLETHGFSPNDWRNNPSDDPGYRSAYLDRMSRTVERDKNHASVVMWSLGNEAGTGQNLAAMAEFAKTRDPGRIVHYEADFRETAYTDVYSRMYANIVEVQAVGERSEVPLADPAAEKRRASLPFILCEYVHAMGNGPGGMTEYQQLFETYDRVQGGFVWEWVEHGIHTVGPDGKQFDAYGGDFGELVHDGNFVMDGLVSADRVPRPGLLDFKKVIEPVGMSVADDWSSVAVTNKFDFSDLSGLAFGWAVTSAEGELASGTVQVSGEAGGKTVVELPPEARSLHGSARVLTLRAVLAQDTAWAQAGHEIAWAQAGTAASVVPAVTASAALVVGVDELALGPARFDRTSGRLVSFRGIALDGPDLDLWRAPTDNDNGVDPASPTHTPDSVAWAAQGLHMLQSRTVSVTEADGTLVVVTKVGAPIADRLIDVTFTWRSDGDAVALAVEVQPSGDWTSTWPRIGVDFTLPGTLEQVQWTGLGPGQKYLDTGQAQRWGWFGSSVQDLQVDYARPQENGSRAGVTEARFSDAASGASLRIRGEQFSFAARPWSQATLAAAAHPFDLQPDGFTHLTIDTLQHGIGTASCGPGVLPAYQLHPGGARFELVLD